VILPDFSVDGMLAAIERNRVSHLMAVPVMLQMLVDDPRTPAANLSSVRFVGYGARRSPRRCWGAHLRRSRRPTSPRATA
jgi:acyl-CoA synthetase (AMP-forming)/AMP-acid ligase II